MVKLSLVTPYPDPINELMETYLNDQGFQVANLKSLRLSRSDEIKSVSPEAIFDLARSADTAESEGMLISCTDFQAVPIISALEADIGKPVISSNQATLWRLLTLTGRKTSVKGYGYLMKKPTEEVS